MMNSIVRSKPNLSLAARLFLTVLLSFTLSLQGCLDPSKTPSSVQQGYAPGTQLDLNQSKVNFKSQTIPSGTTVPITFYPNNQYGNTFTPETGTLDPQFSYTSGTSTGTFGPVTANQDGSFTSNFTAIKAGSSISIFVTVDGAQTGDSIDHLTVIPGPISAQTSQVQVPNLVVAAGQTIHLTVSGEDAASNDISLGGENPTFSLDTSFQGKSTGYFGPVTDANNGTYTVSFTGQTSGVPTPLILTVNGGTAIKAQIQVVSAPTSWSNSLVTVSANQVFSGSSVSVALTLYDTFGNPVHQGGHTVSFVNQGGTSTGTFGPVNDTGNGVYLSSFTGIAAGTPTTIQGFLDGIPVSTPQPSVQVLAGSSSLSKSSISIPSSQVTAGGTIPVTLTIRDGNGNLLGTSGSGLTVAISVPAAQSGVSSGTFGPTADQGNGTYIAIFTGTLAGTPVPVLATINGNAITAAPPAAITVTPGPFSISQSTIQVASPTVASGSSILATLTPKDAYGNLVVANNLNVSFSDSNGAGVSTGTYGPVTLLNNGSYVSSFTGGVSGTPTSVSASINGSPVQT